MPQRETFIFIFIYSFAFSKAILIKCCHCSPLNKSPPTFHMHSHYSSDGHRWCSPSSCMGSISMAAAGTIGWLPNGTRRKCMLRVTENASMYHHSLLPQHLPDAASESQCSPRGLLRRWILVLCDLLTCTYGKSTFVHEQQRACLQSWEMMPDSCLVGRGDDVDVWVHLFKNDFRWQV